MYYPGAELRGINSHTLPSLIRERGGFVPMKTLAPGLPYLEAPVLRSSNYYEG